MSPPYTKIYHSAIAQSVLHFLYECPLCAYHHMDLSPFLAAVNIAATIIGTLYCFVLAVIIALRDIREHFERIVFATCIAFALRSVALWLGGMWAWVGYYHIPGAFSIERNASCAFTVRAVFATVS